MRRRILPCFSFLPVLPLCIVKNTVSCENTSQDTTHPSWHTKLIGNYEDRLRRHSSPERIFEYFSSIRKGNETFMTHDDFARSITAFALRNIPPDTLDSKNSHFSLKAQCTQPSEAQKNTYFLFLQQTLKKSQVSPQLKTSILKAQTDGDIDASVRKVFKSS